MQAAETSHTHTSQTGNVNDAFYEAFRRRVAERFTRNVELNYPLFTTDAEGLWDAYLAAFPPESRQHHNCHACRRFIERFGGLVQIDVHGATTPAIWNVEDADTEHAAAIAALEKRVRRAKVNGVFFSSLEVWGEPITGEWIHMFVVPPREIVFKSLVKNADQAMAEKREDYKNVMRALEEFPLHLVTQAVSILKSDSLYRSEKVLGAAEWLANVHTAALTTGRRANAVWRAIATAPAGFCHPRSSMIGTLLDDLASGMAFDEVSRRFGDKMKPTQYQRPQAAPAAGNIAQAEKLVAQMGIARSLERRFARVEEIEALWRPAVPKEEPSRGGVFGHLKPKDAQPVTQPINVPSQKMTWEKFSRQVLPGAQAIDLMVPAVGGFAAVLTATNPDAPPILQWDSPERRNPFSVYVYPNGSRAIQWGLSAHGWCRVTAVMLRPHMWRTNELPDRRPGEFGHQVKGAIFILEGAKDSVDGGLGLFPENLKGELHGVRSTIEAYSRAGKVSGREAASACGLGIQAGVACDAHVRVTDATGTRFEYRIDRWD